MREILFRGKRIDNGEWVYGDLVHIGNKSYISYYYESALSTFINETTEYDGISIVGVAPFIEVVPSTIGQYTGLTDKNGKKIFEGDIVKENDIVHKEEIQIKGKCSTVSFEKGCWVLLSKVTWDFLQTNAKAVEIIGNIHDNPELLKDKPDD